MTGDELRAMIAEIEGRHGADVDFCVGRVWAMRDRLILTRILDNKMRWPDPPKLPIKKKREAAHSRRQKIYDMAKSGMTYKEIGEVFEISGGRVGEIVRNHSHWLRRKSMREVSQ